MAAILPISTIIEIAKISQYLSAVDRATKNAFSGGYIDKNIPLLIYCERTGVENTYNLNQADPDLIAAANYLYAICGPYNIEAETILNNLQQQKPVLTGPSNQATTVGVNATFSVTLSAGVLPVTYQWFLGGVPISGATGSSYVVVNPQLSNNGQIYSVSATNVAGTVFSGPATLTVTNTTEAFAWYGNYSPYAALLAGNDTLDYQITIVNPENNQPISVTWGATAANNTYQVLKYPASQNVKTTYANGFDIGNIPDDNFESIFQANGFNYLVTRRSVSWSLTNTAVIYT